MDALTLSIVVLAIFIIYFATIIRPTGYFTANSLFAYVQLIMAEGTYAILDPSQVEDVKYGYVVAYCTIAYMAASGFLIACDRGAGPDVSRDLRVSVFKPGRVAWLALWFSMIVTLGYFESVGSSAFIDGLKNSFSGGSVDIAGQRLQAYSGSKYFFPGYVNQFKNALLPAVIVLILHYRIHIGRLRILSALLLVGVAVFALFGTGQRQAFITFGAVLLVYLYHVGGKRFPRGTLRVLLGIVVAVLVATVALGRSVALRSTQVGLLGKLGDAFGQFMQRAFQDQQEAAVFGWRYVRTLPVQHGAEWWAAFTGVLPGNRGSDLANRIYATHFGTTRGTDPPSIWVSVYHNFGWVGLATAPFLLALLMVFVSNRGRLRPDMNTLEVIGIAGTFVCLGTWASGDPTYLLNVGIVVYLMLWHLGKRTSQRMEPERVSKSLRPPYPPRGASRNHWEAHYSGQ